VVRYLVKVRGLRPEQIGVFAQQDACGDPGFAGVAKAMRALRGGNEGTILRFDYKRNTVDVDDAVARHRAHKIPMKAVVMVPAYRAAAKFIEKTRDLYPTMIYTSVSFVGSTALADELMLLGPRYANGVIVTQVVPAVTATQSRARQVPPWSTTGLRVAGRLCGGQPAAGGVKTRWSAARHREAGRSARNSA